MADAIKNIGAVAASSNVPLEEQLAILGQLQTTMPGSEAGTLYKAFIMKAAEAGEKLGLSMVDSSGRLKGIIPILKEIQGKFPDLSQAAAQVEIKKAFGSDEAVKFLLQMSQGVAALETNIRSVERAMRTGTAVTEEMARSMNLDIGARLKLVGQQMGNLAEILGRTLLPVVTPVLDAFSRGIVFFQDLARSVPGLTRVLLTLSIGLGAVLTVVGGAIAAVGTIGLMLPAIKAGLAAMGLSIAGIGAVFTTYFLPVVAIIGGVVLAVYLLKRAWESNFGGIQDMILGVWGRIKLVFGAIRALIGGVGEMSAELAQKLEQAGLLGLVVAVFRLYYRVRQFLTGLQQAFASAFGKIRTILEPPVRALAAAFGRLFEAIGSVTSIFSLAAESADASSFRTLGATLGAVLGVIAQIGAYLLKFVVYGLVGVIQVVAWVVRGFVQLGQAVVTSVVKAAQFLYRFFLPLRLLAQALVLVGRVAATLWQVLTGDLSVIDGLKAIGRAVLDYLATPFRWARDVVTGVWGVLQAVFSTVSGFFYSVAAALVRVFVDLPLVRTLTEVFSAVQSFLSGDTTFFEAGKRILIAVGKGIWAAATYPFDVLKQALGWLRSLLPFSDAETGPLSNLTASGSAILKALAQGMTGVLGLPGAVLSRVFAGLGTTAIQGWQVLQSLGTSALAAVAAPFHGIASAASAAWNRITTTAGRAWSGLRSMAARVGAWMKAPFAGLATAASAAWDRVRTAVSGSIVGGGSALLEKLAGRVAQAATLPSRAMLTGALALTPFLAEQVPQVGAPLSRTEPTVLATRAAAPPEVSRLLAETRGALTPGPTSTSSESPGENLRAILDALLGKLDALAERPIDVSVTTLLDGREVAQSVYRDIRERKIKNYETL